MIKKTILFSIFLIIILVIYLTGNFRLSNTKRDGLSQNISLASGEKRHIVMVLEENQGYGNVIGNRRDMPYLNSLADKYAYAKNYYANIHPSMGNYFYLTTGQLISSADNFSGTVTEDNLARVLINSGKTWKEYSENIPQTGYTGANSDSYIAHHNPFSYFSDVRESQDQQKNLVPLSQFSSDLSSGNLPDFSFLVPNEAHDAHSCPSGGRCSNSEKLSSADNWIKQNIDPLFSSHDFQPGGNGIIIVTFDESNKFDRINGGGHIAWIVAGPEIRKNYSSNTFYQHENTLRFILELLGVSEFPGASKDARSMNEFMAGPQNN